MRTVNMQPKHHSDLRLIIGDAIYYLRCWPDGTFDLFARDCPGKLIALGAVGTDGISTGATLRPRLDRFEADNQGITL